MLGSVVRTPSGGKELPKVCCRRTSRFRHLCSQCSSVCGSSLHNGSSAVVRCHGGLGYHKRSHVVRDWFRCLRREEAKGRRLPEMGLPLVKKWQKWSFVLAGRGDRAFELLALSVALVPSRRRLSGSPLLLSYPGKTLQSILSAWDQ